MANSKNDGNFIWVDLRTINEHIKKFNNQELLEDSTIRNFRIVQKEDNRKLNRFLKLEEKL